MFGLINKAIVELIKTRYGEDRWREVLELAGVPDEPFLSMERYPDELSFKLVHAASNHLQIDAEEILQAFGRYWMLYTAERGYGELLKAHGETLPEFLSRLNTLHTRVQLCLPHLVPPNITVEDEAARSLTVHYRSERQGLTPLAQGILEGLGARFGLDLQIVVERKEVSSGEHTAFRICW